jgi:hypothetical protein
MIQVFSKYKSINECLVLPESIVHRMTPQGYLVLRALARSDTDHSSTPN